MFKQLKVVAVLLAIAPLAPAHVDMGEDYTVPDIPPITVTDNGKEVTITLEDAFKYHGSPCPGVCVAFRAARYAVEMLWDDAVPRSDDIIVLSRGPMRGVMDLFTLVTYGHLEKAVDGVTGATYIMPKKIKPGRDKFCFTFIRKSTGDAVDVELVGTIFPEGFFELVEKHKSETITESEEETLDSYKANIVRKVPEMPVKRLFEPPVRYQVITWGIGPARGRQ